MERHPIDVSQFVTTTQLERSEPKNRFRKGIAYNNILDEVLNKFPDIRDRYNNAYDSYIIHATDPLQTVDNFLFEVYEPILITESVITEVEKLRKPKDSVPTLYNESALYAIIESFDIHSESTSPVVLNMIQQALYILRFTEQEYNSCYKFNELMSQISQLQKKNTLHPQIPEIRVQAQHILDSLRPKQDIKKE